MTELNSKLNTFKILLDKEHKWPCEYVFKFIVKSELIQNITSQLDAEKISCKESSAGKYISVTYKPLMRSSDEVIAVYERLSTVPGLITL